MNERQKFSVVVLGVLLFLAGYLVGKNVNNLAANPPVAPQAIKIGFIGPLSGSTASLGENMKVAVELARDEANVKGGINGRKIEVIFEDGKCESKAAAAAGAKLLNIDKVVAVIGGVCSTETLAVAPLAEKAKVPMISAASTNAKSTTNGYTFRFTPTDSFQGKFAAEHIVNDLGKKRVGILACMSDYCTGMKEVFKKRLTELGGTLVTDVGFEKGSRALFPQLVKIRAVKPEVIYFVSYADDAIIGLKQMKDLRMTIPVFGADAWDDPKIGEQLKASANGTQYAILANQPLPKNFVEEMTKRLRGKALVAYAPRAYDAFNALADIIKKQGATSENIEKGLKSLKDWKGIADTYTMDASGDMASAQYVIKEFKDGKAVEIKQQAKK